MTIKIIDEDTITLTRSEYERLHGKYLQETRNWYGVNPPPSFETWLRSRGEEEDPFADFCYQCDQGE